MKNRLLFLNVASFLLVFANCTNEKKTENTPKIPQNLVSVSSEQYKTVGVVLGGLERRNMRNQLKVNGILDVPPQNLVSVSAVMGGFVRQTEMLQGMSVKQGQLLAMLEHPDYVQLQQDFIETKNRLEYANLDFERQKQLNTDNVSATKTFQMAVSDKNSLQNRLNGLTQKLAMLGISPAQLQNNQISRTIGVYAPKSGYITAVNVNLGKYVQPNDVMFEISNTEHLHAEIYVFEKDINKIKIDQNVTFYLPNDLQKSYKAHIHLIGKQIEAPDRTVRVHCHFEEPYPDLLPKMYIKAEIAVEDDTSEVLPEEAIVFFEGKNYVFVQREIKKNETTFELTEVKKGTTENGFVEVSFIENIDKKSQGFVKKGAFELLAKMKNSEEE